MAIKTQVKAESRLKRKVRVRKKVFGTAERPRLTVFRSAKHIYAQVINDFLGHTLVAVSTNEEDLRQRGTGKKVEAATLIGKTLAERCKAQNIEAVVFDRNGYRYHGRVLAVAEGARQGGLRF